MNTFSQIKALLTAAVLMCLLTNIPSVHAQQSEAPVTEKKAKVLCQVFSRMINTDILKNAPAKSQVQTSAPNPNVGGKDSYKFYISKNRSEGF